MLIKRLHVKKKEEKSSLIVYALTLIHQTNWQAVTAGAAAVSLCAVIVWPCVFSVVCMIISREYKLEGTGVWVVQQKHSEIILWNLDPRLSTLDGDNMALFLFLNYLNLKKLMLQVPQGFILLTI